MDSLIIGVANIVFTTDGKLKEATFTPAVKSDCRDLAARLIDVKASSQDDIKEYADSLLAAWFNKVSDIELADREHYAINSVIDKCEKHPDDSIKEVVVTFKLDKIN